MYFIFDIVSFDISSICRHFNGSPILCPINATSSSSYVFRLQYPRVLHCRIVLKEKIENITCTLKEKTSHNKFRIGIKTNHLKVTRNLRENSSTGGGANIFTKRCSPPQQFKFQLNILYLLYFMI